MRRCGILGDMVEEKAGYKEIEHTADWQLHVWAEDLPGLLEQAALGMFELAQVRLGDTQRFTEEFELEFFDRESLLVDFLSELLYYAEEQNLAFDGYQLEIQEHKLRARVNGAPIEFQAKEIKAVTYHCLDVRKTDHGFEVRIVFDV